MYEMTLTTHILVGGAVATPFIATGNLPLAFGASLASHYLIDTIPHWQYRLPSIENAGDVTERSFTNNKKLVFLDLFKTGLDVLFGSSLLLLFARATDPKVIFIYLVIAFLAVLPDGLQGIQTVYKKWPMSVLQKFHDFFHWDNKGEGDLPWSPVAFLSQLAIVIIAVLVIV